MLSQPWNLQPFGLWVYRNMPLASYVPVMCQTGCKTFYSYHRVCFFALCRLKVLVAEAERKQTFTETKMSVKDIKNYLAQLNAALRPAS